MLKILSNVFAILWFFGVLLWTLLFGMLIIIIVFFEIISMLKSGGPTFPLGLFCCFFIGIVFFVTGWVPVFRKCYYKLPWLYPFSMMMVMHLYILSIAESILVKGFSVMSTPRHIMTVVIMVIQVVACRAAMCLYLHKYPMVLRKYERVE